MRDIHQGKITIFRSMLWISTHGLSIKHGIML